MACSGASRFTDDFLTCSICFEIYKEPKILNCLHTFCKTCLQTFITTANSKCNVSCPICRLNTQVQEDNASNLKTNFYIQNLINFNEVTSTTSEARYCSFCSILQKSNIAKSTCLTCGDFLCEQCQNCHNLTTKTYSHEVVSLDKLQRGEYNEEFRMKQDIPCPNHKGESIRYFCETCKISVCRDCVILNHRENHDIISPSEAIEKRRKKISSLLDILDTRKFHLEDVMQKLQHQEHFADEALRCTSKIVQSAVDRMIQKVRNEGKSVQEMLKSDIATRKEIINQKRKNKVRKRKIFDDAILFCRHILKDGREGEIAFLQEMIQERLSFLEQNIEDEDEIGPWSPPSIRLSEIFDKSLHLFDFKSASSKSNSIESITMEEGPDHELSKDKTFVRTSCRGDVTARNLSRINSRSIPNLDQIHTTSCNVVTFQFIETIDCMDKNDRSCFKLTSITWYNESSFVVADEHNGKLKHMGINGMIIKVIPVPNIITVTRMGKDIYCGLTNGSVKVIKSKNGTLQEISVIPCDFPRNLVTVRNSQVLAIGGKCLYNVSEWSEGHSSIPINMSENNHIFPMFPIYFKTNDIIVNDWITKRVLLLRECEEKRKSFKVCKRGPSLIFGGLCADSKNNIYVANFDKNRISVLNENLEYKDTIDIREVNRPRSMSCSENDQLLICCTTGVAYFKILHDLGTKV